MSQVTSSTNVSDICEEDNKAEDPLTVNVQCEQTFSLVNSPSDELVSDPVNLHCDECNRTYRNTSGYKRHLEACEATRPSPLVVLRITKVLPSEEVSLTKKVNPKSSCEERNFLCEYCGRQFVREQHLKRHFINTGCDGSPRQTYPCTVCGKLYTRKDNVYEHLRAVHSGQARRKKLSACEYCDKVCSSKPGLTIHLRTHTGERPFLCEFCQARFSSRAGLRKHRRRHTGEKPYQCELCKTKFAAKETLNRHIKTHTGVKPHRCQYCGKRFIQPHQLRAHVFHHTGVNGFHCKICGKAFNRRALLSLHSKYFHEGQKPFTCEICSKTFIRKKDLAEHTLQHTGIKNHKCPTCDKAFAIKAALKTHMLTHTREPPCSCDECGRAFIRRDCLMRHLRNYHRNVVEEIMIEAERKKLRSQLLGLTPVQSESHNKTTLLENVKDLILLLVDETTLETVGYPLSSVESVLEALIHKSGHEPASKELGFENTLRENARLFFTEVVDDSTVKKLLETQSVDDVITYVLKLAEA